MRWQDSEQLSLENTKTMRSSLLIASHVIVTCLSCDLQGVNMEIHSPRNTQAVELYYIEARRWQRSVYYPHKSVYLRNPLDISQYSSQQSLLHM